MAGGIYKKKRRIQGGIQMYMKRAVEEEEEEVIGMTDIFAEDIPSPRPPKPRDYPQRAWGFIGGFCRGWCLQMRSFHCGDSGSWLGHAQMELCLIGKDSGSYNILSGFGTGRWVFSCGHPTGDLNDFWQRMWYLTHSFKLPFHFKLKWSCVGLNSCKKN